MTSEMPGRDPKAPVRPGSLGDRVPDSVVRAAMDAITHASGTELATLVYDSLVDGSDPATDHVLRFEHPELTVELRVRSTDEEVSLEGAASPPTSVRAELHTAGIDLAQIVDASNGKFEFPSLPHGLVRLVVARTGGADVTTDWFRA